MPEVVVIGAGVIGSAVAYRLAQAGAAVTVIEGGPAPGGGTSSATMSVDVTHGKTPRALFDLSLAAAREHARLADELDGTWHHPVGHLEWAVDGPRLDLVRDRIERLRSWGYPVTPLTPAQACEIEPALDPRSLDGATAVHFPDKAWYDAPAFVHQLLAALVDRGGRVVTGEPVDRLDVAGGRIVRVGTVRGTTLRPDAVVCCAGPDSRSVLGRAGLDVPLRRVPGLVVTLRPPAPLLRGIVGAPGVALRPGPDGCVAMNSWEIDAALGTRDQAGLADRLRARAAALIPDLRSAEVESVAVGVRPVPLDGLPLVGWMPPVGNLYTVVSHSGVHLAPLLARLAAHEIATGEIAPPLAPFRPQRPTGERSARPLDESTRVMTDTVAGGSTA